MISDPDIDLFCICKKAKNSNAQKCQPWAEFGIWHDGLSSFHGTINIYDKQKDIVGFIPTISKDICNKCYVNALQNLKISAEASQG